MKSYKDLGFAAKDVYKVRISKGFVDAKFGEGFLVEVWDFRAQRIVYGEKHRELEKARKREKEIRVDLEQMPLEKFQQTYLRKKA